MTSTLIVLAHPDRRSVNGTWAEATELTSIAMGHDVMWSDLYAMRFDPVEKQAHYSGVEGVQPFDVLKTQEAAASSKNLPPDVAGEIGKIRDANRVVFHFPLWWFSLPAILKGWCDRVLANGALHDAEARFDRGQCRDKRALFCVTTGATASESEFNGKEGDVRMLLWPFAQTLRYLGFTVLQPRILHGVHSYHEGEARTELLSRLRREIETHKRTIENFDSIASIPFNPDSDFDEEGRMRPDAESYSPFIRHQR